MPGKTARRADRKIPAERKRPRVESGGAATSNGTLPLAGVRVLEFTQLIMGPVAGLILADLGADVIKVEPAPNGDPTRQLTGFVSGFSDFFNRNKRSVGIDLKHADARRIVASLCRHADVVIENFAPGTMERLGCGREALARHNPALIYCSLKGFLPGPYEHRTALDEVVQFMGGLAYMTGPRGRPLRAGTSVVDLMGGTMAAVAVLAALRERDRTGRGPHVQAGLFESVAFLMGQHMAAVAINGEDLPPMPEREGGWAIYQPFTCADGRDVFVAVTSDALFRRFCEEFRLGDLAGDARLQSNAGRIEAREWLIPRIASVVGALSASEVMSHCDRAAVPYAPVSTVQDLFDDPHLRQSGALVDVALRTGRHGLLPGLPIRLDGRGSAVRRQPPRTGEHTREVLADAGFSDDEIVVLAGKGAICMP